MGYNDDPFFRYSLDEKKKMTQEEFFALIEESNDYVLKAHSQINEGVAPKFNTIEELRAYYNCIPLDEVLNNMDKLFEDYMKNNPNQKP